MYRKDKVVMIGPVYPYIGGISHYTGMMYKALNKRYDITMVSYKLQYPKILLKKEQRDYTNDNFKIQDTNYWINTCNPLNWITTARKLCKEKPSFIICQWWHPFFAPCYLLLALLTKRQKWIFVCHNVFPHERFFLDKELTKLALRRGNAFVVQAKTDAENLKAIIKNPVFEQTVHPTYHAFCFGDLSKETGRQLVGLNSHEKVLLFFGFVREYKGLKYLLQALPEMVNSLSDLKLLIVGDFGNDKEQYLEIIQELKIENYISIYEGYIPDKDVEKYFAACDLVVLPYESATQSGIVQIAYGFAKPVIVTNVGGLPDVVTDGQTGYVVEPRNPGQLAEVVVRYFEEKKDEVFTENVRKEAFRFSWDRMVEVIEKLADGIL